MQRAYARRTPVCECGLFAGSKPHEGAQVVVSHAPRQGVRMRCCVFFCFCPFWSWAPEGIPPVRHPPRHDRRARHEPAALTCRSRGPSGRAAAAACVARSSLSISRDGPTCDDALGFDVRPLNAFASPIARDVDPRPFSDLTYLTATAALRRVDFTGGADPAAVPGRVPRRRGDGRRRRAFVLVAPRLRRGRSRRGPT